MTISPTLTDTNRTAKSAPAPAPRCGPTAYHPEAAGDEPTVRCACGAEAVYDPDHHRNECDRTGAPLHDQPPAIDSPQAAARRAAQMITAAVVIEEGRR